MSQIREGIIYQISGDDLRKVFQDIATDELLTKEEAAKLVKVSTDTIDNMVQKEVITPYYDQRPNMERPIVRYSRVELMTKTFAKIRKI